MSLTDEERDRIIADRLGGATVRAICRQYGHSPNTVVAVYREHCAQYGHELAEHNLATHAEQILEARRVADWARQEAVKYQRVTEDGKIDGKVVHEGNPAAFARLLALELSAHRHLAKLTGAESPVRVEVDARVEVDVALEDQRKLADYVAELCRSLN